MIDVREVGFESAEQLACVELRLRLLRGPLGLTFTPEELADESEDVHIAAFDGSCVIGCLVLVRIGTQAMKMRQVAVEPNYRGQGIGRRLVELSERVAVRDGFDLMTLHARDTAVAFYTALGYTVVGEPFEEVTIPHRAMQKRLVKP